MAVSPFAISAGCTDREGLMQALGLQHASEKCEALGPEKPSLAVKPRLNTLPLTVFYGGQVSVYNNVSSETVQAIMAIAAKGNWLSQVTLTDAMHINPDSFFSQARATAGNFHCDVQTKDPITFPITQTSCVCTSNVPSYYPAMNTIIENSTEPMVPEALPLARKASLIRFLEKRKERMLMVSPYYKDRLIVTDQRGQTLGSKKSSAFTELYEQYCRRTTLVTHMEQKMHISSRGILPNK